MEVFRYVQSGKGVLELALKGMPGVVELEQDGLVPMLVVVFRFVALQGGVLDLAMAKACQFVQMEEVLQDEMYSLGEVLACHGEV